VRWCDLHQPRYGGSDDERAKVSRDILTSTGEAEGVTNREWCQFVHRTSKRLNSAKKSYSKAKS